MSRLKIIFTKRFPACLRVLPGGFILIPVFYVLSGVWLNYVLVYSLATGKMLGRYATGWIEGRESSPLLYWLYVLGIGAFTLLMDGFAVYLLARPRDER